MIACTREVRDGITIRRCLCPECLKRMRAATSAAKVKIGAAYRAVGREDAARFWEREGGAS